MLADGIGLLDWSTFERFRNAVNAAPKLVSWLRVAGHVKSGDPDELRTRSQGPSLPLPATWLAAEQIANLLGELQRFPELEDAANNTTGVEIAGELMREVETAQHRWPVEDRPHRVKWLRCRKCAQLTVKYLPPRFEGDAVAFKCSDIGCATLEDADAFSVRAMLVERELRENAGFGRLDTDKQSA